MTPPKPAIKLTFDTSLRTLSTAHAPVGGLDAEGKHFTGGEFVPGNGGGRAPLVGKKDAVRRYNVGVKTADVRTMLSKGDADLHVLVGDAMANAPDLSEQQQNERREAAKSVFSRIPPAALDHLRKTINFVSACNNPEAVNAYWEKTGEPLEDNEEVGGIWYGNPGRLVINGGHSDEENKLNSIRRILAHELGHALDTVKMTWGYSKTARFLACYKKEIAAGQLCPYARKNPQEGFAEFAALLYGTDVPHEKIKSAFPDTFGFFRELGYC